MTSAKTIEIIVSPTGQTKVETKGFAGEDCREATRKLEEALGRREAEVLTTEFYAPAEQVQNLTEQG